MWQTIVTVERDQWWFDLEELLYRPLLWWLVVLCRFHQSFLFAYCVVLWVLMETE